METRSAFHPPHGLSLDVRFQVNIGHSNGRSTMSHMCQTQTSLERDFKCVQKSWRTEHELCAAELAAESALD